MPKDVFISYSTGDKALAEKVCETLEGRGIACWIAPRDIAPGAVFDEAILEGIDETHALVLILSAHANASPFVKNEVNRAFAKGKTMFTFRVQADVTPGRSLEFYLARHQWTDGFPPPLEEKIHRLAAAILALVGKTSPKEIAPTETLTLATNGRIRDSHVVMEQPVSNERRAVSELPMSLSDTVGDKDPIRTIQGNHAWIAVLQFSPDGRVLTSGCERNGVQLWSSETGKLLHALQGCHGDGIADRWHQSIAFSPDGRFVVSATGLQSDVKFWDATNGQIIRILKGHTAAVKAVAFSPDGSTIATGGDDESVRLWDARTGILLHRQRGVHSARVLGITFSPNGDFLATRGMYESAIWEIRTWTLVRTLETNYSVQTVLAFSRDGETLATTEGEKKLCLCDVKTQTVRSAPKLEQLDEVVLAVSADLGMVATARGFNGSVWDVRTGERIAFLDDHDKSIRVAAFAPNCRLIATGSEDMTVKLWEL